jgi:hypothetical protein
MIIANRPTTHRIASYSAFAMGLLLAVASAWASVPVVINYQGRLTDNTPQQNPIDATVSVDFSIWDSATGGLSLWSETQSVQVVKGLFNAVLGSTTSIPPSVFTTGTTRYLELHVSGETLAPRQRIATTPYAMASASADDSASLGGLGAAAYQRRIATPCPNGYAVNAVAADGTTTCIQGLTGPPGPAGAGLDTGAISGTVTSCGPSAAGTVVYVPGRSAVSYAASDGTYLLSYLPAGTYSVQIGPLGGPPATTVNGVAVSSGQTTGVGSRNLQDLSSDATNCGACGAACSTSNISRACAAGSCESGVCLPSFGDCNANKRSDGCEVNLASSAGNCGGCGVVCSSTNIPVPTCAAGVCNGACASGTADCNGNKQIDGCERVIINDVNNCGGCGVVCSNNHIPTPTCNGSFCSGTCAPGWGNCHGYPADGCETNVTADNSNCGYCGNACGIFLHCSNGSCVGP